MSEQTDTTPGRGRLILPIVLLVLAAAVVGVTIHIATRDPEPERSGPAGPSPGEKVYAHARSLMDRGAYGDARKVMESYLGQNPQDVRVRTLLGETLLELEQYDRARAALRAAVRLNPENARAWMLLGDLDKRTGGKAFLQYYRRAAESPYATPAAWTRIGRELLAAGALDEAQRYLRRAYDAGAATYPVLSGLGQLAYRREERAEAIDFLRRATQADPRRAPAWGLLAQALKDRDRLDEAERVLREAVESVGGAGKGLLIYELAQTLFAAGKHGEAAKLYGRASEFPRLAPRASVQAARAYYFGDRYALAMKYIDRAARLMPGNRDVAEWRRKIEDARFGPAEGTRTREGGFLEMMGPAATRPAE